MKLVFATHNAGKLQEVRQILAPKYEVIGLADLNLADDIVEDAPTLEGNALIKARTIYQEMGLACFSDDTGLEIDALNGAPGVLSARYAGPDKDPEANMSLVLKELRNKANRGAQFRTSIALIIKGQELLFDGVVRGHIAEEKSGSKGFGYDPIFIPEGHDITFAAMSAEEKNKISHRGRAMAKLLEYLQSR
jgi:XTP/dITP diphosphohydrolase